MAIGGSPSIQDPLKKMLLYDPCWDFYHKIKTEFETQFDFLQEMTWRYGPMLGKWDCLDSVKDGLITVIQGSDPLLEGDFHAI